MPTDEELAQRIQHGNAEGLAELVARHHSPLLGFLYRLTGGDRALAEDLVQESFLRVLRGIARYRYPRPFKPWLYAIAVNAARDHFKRAETRRAAALPGDALAADPPPDAGLLADDEVLRLNTALRALPVQQREALLLRYQHDFTLEQIAQALGVPVGTVKSRLSLGLKRLRERLTEDEQL